MTGVNVASTRAGSGRTQRYNFYGWPADWCATDEGDLVGDLIYVALTLAVFALLGLLVRGVERL